MGDQNDLQKQPSVELPLREAYPFGDAHGLRARVNQIRGVATLPGVHPSVYRRALIAELFTERNVLEKFISLCWPYGSTPGGQKLLARYQRVLVGHVSVVAATRSVNSVSVNPGTGKSSSPGEEGAASSKGAPGLLAFVRGMAIFQHRRVAKHQQEELLRRYLPHDVGFLGAFDKSGNYALTSEESTASVACTIAEALRHHEKLHDLEALEVTVVAADEARQALELLAEELSAKYGSAFDGRSFGVQLGGNVWRTGLTFIGEPRAVAGFSWPGDGQAKVLVFGSSGAIVRFIKREEEGEEDRISFGDPTRAVDMALGDVLERPVVSTSRSARTVRGALRKFRSGAAVS